MSTPLISICIPSYKRIVFLERLLKSIEEQSFRDFEIIIADDSPDTSVELLIRQRFSFLPVLYLRNQSARGTPANWNFAIGKCTGTWIKLMHDDDWFASKNSLQAFADATRQNKKFIFSAYVNHFDTGAEAEPKRLPVGWGGRILKQPMTLLAYNVIGPPSVTMIHHSITERYDESLKWRVDMEYYLRLIEQTGEFQYIPESLINVGVSESQVTQSCIYQPQVELPEGKRLLQLHGDYRLRNIRVYDAWWRLLRNMNIINAAQLTAYAPGAWPLVITKMVGHLAIIPKTFLHIGIFSKTFMFVSYLKNLPIISRQH
jgi:glycosyltransferase involved in cell wall biosynthesis